MNECLVYIIHIINGAWRQEALGVQKDNLCAVHCVQDVYMVCLELTDFIPSISSGLNFVGAEILQCIKFLNLLPVPSTFPLLQVRHALNRNILSRIKTISSRLCI